MVKKGDFITIFQKLCFCQCLFIQANTWLSPRIFCKFVKRFESLFVKRKKILLCFALK
ncbi:hypothetical protein M23134_04158 [Microscilla marina ATCC 23134]|uniref:Uncharacterized protein n=1 Tax=Microscilla marina ATCC 23134 TaxID=313606 RepID=A1ZE17_MICM2|nr:hypothetical protein M23134_04158 [Microscilla marina ATCC 23134]